MLKAIAWLIKASAFALIVLVVGNYFRIGNKTISDQVKTQLSHAERVQVPKVQDAVHEVKDWAHQLTSDQKSGIVKKTKALRGGHAEAAPEVPRIAPPGIAGTRAPELKKVSAASAEEIPSSERQKLRALMRELNSARDSDQ